MTNTQTLLYLTARKSLTEISRCQEYAINGQEMEQLESPFGSIFLSFLKKVDGCQACSSCWNFNKFCDTAALITVYFNQPSSFLPKLEFHYPGYQMFFLCVVGIFVVGQKATHFGRLVGRSHERQTCEKKRVTIKTWQKPETTLEKSLAPRVEYHV